MADISKEDLAEAIAKAMNSNNSAPKSGGGGSGPDLEFLKKLALESSSAAIGLNRLTTGATAAESVLQGIGKLGGMIPGLGGLSSALGEAGTAALKNKAQLDEAGKIGLGGNNLGLYNRQVAELGVSTADYNKLMKESGNNIGGLAGSAQRSSEAFTRLGADVRESGTGKQLQQLGVTTDELAQITALSAMNGKKLAAQGTEDYKKQSAAAQELASQIAETSLITGMNREAITKSVEAETKKPGVMLAMMQMDQDQKNNFLKTQTQISSLGPSVQSLASEIVTGGVRTKEGIATMTALGPAGEELQRAVKQQQSLSKDASEEEKRRAKEAVDMATAKVNERIASKEYAQIANTATGETANQMLKIASENKGVQTQMAAVAEAGGDLAKATKAQRDEAQARIKGDKVDETGKPVTRKDADGKDVRVVDEGTLITRSLNEANSRAIIQANGLAINFEKLNNNASKFNDALGGFVNLAGKETTGKEAAEKNAGIVEKVMPKTEKSDADKKTKEEANVRPKLAEGGIVEPKAGGTDAIIGEGGKTEAVIPLDKLDGMLKPKDTGGINVAEISKTISTTLSSAQTPNESKGAGADTGPLESTLSEYQKTVLKYAATEGEMKQVQIDNEKNIIRGKEAVILENKNRIAEIEKAADGRELTRREQSRIEKIQAEIQGQQESMAMHKEALAVYENIDALSNQTVVEAKKTAADETMASLKDQEAAGYAANRAAAMARDALEEKAEAEGRAMTEAEEAQYKLLGVELNASSNKITAAQEAQKELERAEQQRAFQAKIEENRASLATESAIQATEIAKINASEQNNIQEVGKNKALEYANETIKINGKIVDPGSPEGQAVKAQMAKQAQDILSAGLPMASKIEEAKSFMAKTLGSVIPDPAKLQEKLPSAADLKAQYTKMSTDLNASPEALTKLKAQLDSKVSQDAMPKAGQPGFATEQKKQMEGMFANIGSGGGILGDMFNPKIIDTKLAEANKAKLAEVKKEEPKPAPAPVAKPAEKPPEAKPANTEIGIKDLNDQLKMLNMNMLKLISHSETISGASEKTAKNSAKATGNRYA